MKINVPHDGLHETVVSIFEKMGVTSEDSELGADVLVSTDLRGVETHGVSNMLRAYVQGYSQGTLNPRPDWKVERESAATATINADRGLAVILGPKAMDIAIQKARNVGMGVVTMYNAGHSGAIGHHAMLAAKADMVGMTATAGGLGVLPTFGAEPRLGTNPLAIAAPAKSEPFLLFDAATSAIAGNKLGLASRVGANLLGGWIAGPDGDPILDEVPMPERGQYYQLPLGGTREQGAHKGYGFSLMSEVLASMLSGDKPSMLIGRRREPPLLRGVQYRLILRPGRVQAEHGRYAADAARHSARPGPRARSLPGPLRARGGTGTAREGHTAPQRGHRVVQRHLRRTPTATPTDYGLRKI